jgi:hypothetical protein
MRFHVVLLSLVALRLVAVSLELLWKLRHAAAIVKNTSAAYEIAQAAVPWGGLEDIAPAAGNFHNCKTTARLAKMRSSPHPYQQGR